MKKKTLITSVITALLVVCVTAAIFTDTFAFATGQSAAAKSKTKQPKQTTVRKGRFTEINTVSEAAAVLNVKPIWILDEVKKGKTMAQIINAKGMTEQEFIQKATELETKTIQDAVKSGSMSQAHADALQAGMSDRLKENMKMKAMDVKEHAAMNMNH
ncbi:hypothetical protein [Ectobacillus ponti]|uniref:Uncharacterized protein n=1 Tax=Ectobacillus ponti TaxID=2961894 RepID=A0AA41X8E3_9BACI|nr:hypothetical protein [Ectobacillus ponti]MCP8968584.1 hypothetical protein [Ectobacillus ponti]